MVKEASDLLSNTEYAGATIHFMPQKVDDPDCHVVTFEVSIVLRVTLHDLAYAEDIGLI